MSNILWSSWKSLRNNFSLIYLSRPNIFFISLDTFPFSKNRAFEKKYRSFNVNSKTDFSTFSVKNHWLGYTLSWRDALDFCVELFFVHGKILTLVFVSGKNLVWLPFIGLFKNESVLYQIISGVGNVRWELYL